MNLTLNEHYCLLLGVETPWSVNAVKLDVEGKLVEIDLTHAKGVRVECPECHASCPVHDEAPERTWRHLDTMQFETRLRARVPRCKCPQCGVKTVPVPWAGKHSRFTVLFEAFAITVIQASSSIEAACILLGLDWSACDAIMKRAVERGLAKREHSPVKHLGIDEKSFRSGHRYISVLNDLTEGRVLEVVEGRKESDAAQLFAALTDAQREKVEAVALDMWQAYISAAKRACPGADLVHDKFHISKYLNGAVNQVRATEAASLCSQGDRRLNGTRWWWLYNEENLKVEVVADFEKIKNSELKTARAWAIKECFGWFWEPHLTQEEAREYFSTWYSWAIRSRLEPVKKVARMLKSHFNELLNWCKHHITNAVSEGINSRIQSIKSAARGFHSFESYRARILFYCGKLDLSPYSFPLKFRKNQIK
jgi:transposase